MKSVISVRHVSKSFVSWENRTVDLKTMMSQLASGRLQRNKKQIIEVLHDVSFDIAAGEFVGIMGANGAGKSTVLKLITGIYSPTNGKIEIDGKIAPLLELGAGFAGELSGYENIFLNAAILGFNRARVRQTLDSIIEFSELGPHIDKPVKNYSSGMLVRLGFSIAAHLDSNILLFDEILAVGDLGFQAKCLKKISELHKEGRAIILVSHSPEQVLNHCSRVILINHKTVEYDGPVQPGVARYKELLSKAAPSQETFS